MERSMEEPWRLAIQDGEMINGVLEFDAYWKLYQVQEALEKMNFKTKVENALIIYESFLTIV